MRLISPQVLEVKSIKTAILHKKRVKITAGHLIQVDEYEKGFWTGFDSAGGRKKDEEGQDKEKNRKDVARRRFQAVIDLVNRNFNVKYAKFITLTYREDVKDIDRAAKDLDNWLKQVRRKLGNIRYFWVIQFQDLTRGGVIHYHLLLDYQPKLSLSWLNGSWPHGRTDVKAVTRVDNVGAYLGKYMARLEDRRLDGRKAYGHSRNLHKPEVIYGKDAMVMAERLKEKTPVFVRETAGEWTGKCLSTFYNLKRSHEQSVTEIMKKHKTIPAQ